jgi:hypothetical protein
MRIIRWNREEERREPDKGKQRRSVYENRFTEEAEEESIPLGEIDPQTGRSTVDYSRATGWVSLPEFLWRR